MHKFTHFFRHTHMHIHSNTHTHRNSSAMVSPAQCLHPGVVVDLADSDDEDCQFHSLQEPVTAALAGCPCRVPVCRMECQHGR